MGLFTTRARLSPRLGRRTDRLWALGREGAGGCQFSGEDPGLVTAQPEARTPCLLGTGRSRPACGVCGGRSPVQYRLSQQMGCLWVQEPRHANPGREQEGHAGSGTSRDRGRPPALTTRVSCSSCTSSFFFSSSRRLRSPSSSSIFSLQGERPWQDTHCSPRGEVLPPEKKGARQRDEGTKFCSQR